MDNPKTNDIEISVKELVWELSSEDFFKLDTDDPAIKAKYGGTIGKTQGDKKLRIPAENEISTDIINDTSVSSWPNIIFPSLLEVLGLLTTV